MEVLDIDVLVRCSFALAPKEQTFLGGHFLHGDVLNGEPEDDGPDHTKSHLDVAIDDFWNYNFLLIIEKLLNLLYDSSGPDKFF